jgi:hypothetical protein
MLAAHHQTFRGCLELSPDPDLAEAGLACLHGSPGATLLGAAAIVEAAGMCMGWQDAARLTTFAEVWQAERGLPVVFRRFKHKGPTSGRTRTDSVASGRFTRYTILKLAKLVTQSLKPR